MVVSMEHSNLCPMGKDMGNPVGLELLASDTLAVAIALVSSKAVVRIDAFAVDIASASRPRKVAGSCGRTWRFALGLGLPVVGRGDRVAAGRSARAGGFLRLGPGYSRRTAPVGA